MTKSPVAVARSYIGSQTMFSRGPLALAMLVLLSNLAAAEYRVASGDVLEIAVVGMPDFRTRTPVNVEGMVNVPLLGSLNVVGKSLPEVETKVQQVLSEKVFYRRGADGRENK